MHTRMSSRVTRSSSSACSSRGDHAATTANNTREKSNKHKHNKCNTNTPPNGEVTTGKDASSAGASDSLLQPLIPLTIGDASAVDVISSQRLLFHTDTSSVHEQQVLSETATTPTHSSNHGTPSSDVIRGVDAVVSAVITRDDLAAPPSPLELHTDEDDHIHIDTATELPVCPTPDEENSAAAVTTVRADAAAAATVPTTPPAPVHVQRARSTMAPYTVNCQIISGEESQCWYAATAQAMSTTKEEVQQSVIRAINKLPLTNDAANQALWVRLGLLTFDANCNVTQEMFHAARADALKRDEIVNMRNATNMEMCLYSYAHGGSVGFRVFSLSSVPKKSSIRHDHVLTSWCYNSHVNYDDAQVKTEINLLHCPIRPDATAVASHYDLLTFHSSDDSVRHCWTSDMVSELSPDDAAAHHKKRIGLSMRAAEVAAKMRMYKYSAQERSNYEAAVRLAGPGYSGRQQRHTQSDVDSESESDTDTDVSDDNDSSTDITTRAAPTVVRRAASTPVAAPFSPSFRRRQYSAMHRAQSTHHAAANVSANHRRAVPSDGSPLLDGSRGDWKKHRASTIRELHGRPCALFCQTVNLLFDRYRQLASVDMQHRDHGQIAALVAFILTYPSIALIKARRLNNNKRVDYLQQLHNQTIEKLRTMQPMIDTTPAAPVAVLSRSVVIHDTVPPEDLDDEKTSCENNVIVSDSTRRTAASEEDDDDTDDEDEQVKSVRRSVAILREGGPHCIQRSAKALSSTPLAPMNDDTYNKLSQLHPTATQPMGTLPASAVETASMDMDRLSRVINQRIHNGSSPGLSGWSGSHVAAFWQKATAEASTGFALFIQDILNGVFAGEIMQRLLASVLIPLSKPNAGVRPIAIAEVFVRTASHYAMDTISQHMPTLFPKIQYGVQKPGGSETAAQLIRYEIEYKASKDIDVVAISTDFKNAFNQISRQKVWDALQSHPQLAPILKPFYWQYNQPSPLLIYDRGQLRYELSSSDGVRQGCPFAGFAFALTVQPVYEASIADKSNTNGFSIQDDFTIVGPYKEALAAFDYIKCEIQSQLNLQLVNHKCQVYIPKKTAEDAMAAAEIHRECAARQLSYSDKFTSLGVLHGDSAAVHSHCDSAVTDAEKFFAGVTHKLMPTQIGTALHRYCGIPKMGYLSRTIHPNHISASAQKFDQMALQAQLEIVGISAEETLTALQSHSDGVADSVDTAHHSYVTKQQLLSRVQLPVSMSGLGVRPVQRITHAAYFASLVQMLPEFLKLHSELHVYEAFLSTQLCADLCMCRDALIAQGAGESHGAGDSSCMRTQSEHEKSKFPKPSVTLTQDIKTTWEAAITFIKTCTADQPFTSAQKLQHSLTQSIESSVWSKLHTSVGRYQQTIMTSLTMNPSTSAWLTTLPLSHEPGYHISDDDYKLAVRHRLGMLPYDKLLHQQCTTCAARNKHTADLKSDPDHMHSCITQTGASVYKRHNAVVSALSSLARSCGYSTQHEPLFPDKIIESLNTTTNQTEQLYVKADRRGDLLMIRHDQQLLIDVTIKRPTRMTSLNNQSLAVHCTPLITATRAEQRKHEKYDAHCAVMKWKMTPFAMESYGAKGREADKLLRIMSAHCMDKSPRDFLQHAERMISVALQCGNAHVAAAGTAELSLCEYRHSCGTDQIYYPSHRGPSVMQQRRAASIIKNHTLADIMHCNFQQTRLEASRQVHVVDDSVIVSVAA